MSKKARIATTSLCGCFGCHMSVLDIDERLFDLVELVDFDRSPLTDIKQVGDCDIGIIEGGVANEENVEVLRSFRENCKILIAMGACAINGGVPAMRNAFTLEECLRESYIDGVGVSGPMIPCDAEIPLLLDKVYPLHEVVRIDHYLPGCPPPADIIWAVLTDLLEGREPALAPTQIHYD